MFYVDGKKALSPDSLIVIILCLQLDNILIIVLSLRLFPIGNGRGKFKLRVDDVQFDLISGLIAFFFSLRVSKLDLIDILFLQGQLKLIQFSLQRVPYTELGMLVLDKRVLTRNVPASVPD